MIALICLKPEFWFINMPCIHKQSKTTKILYIYLQYYTSQVWRIGNLMRKSIEMYCKDVHIDVHQPASTIHLYNTFFIFCLTITIHTAITLTFVKQETSFIYDWCIPPIGFVYTLKVRKTRLTNFHFQRITNLSAVLSWLFQASYECSMSLVS